ncbi:MULTISPECIES: YfhO family protein [Caproicibacterium]|uniref:YfhO family protein n=1 Tax=Caproicibacterium argilliputei TaxID=3030016 RepID=A0AA97DAI4_9FIRM|nr:YfhO family protein [Caproicibacterium argilliputei]WOC32309.1 YfhO family protein [Caproicibacterium argilliputei]
MERLQIPDKHRYALRALLLGMGTAAVIFVPFMLYDKGYFLFYGDFNVQQVPFYQMCHDTIRSGNWRWSWTTDLGANFIGSYSFYLLGSPFFWLTIPFPSAAVPYLMGPLYILKFGCACMTGCIYLRRYCQTGNLAVLGGMLYAFSGFSVYNVFFNHFHEAIVFFPLLLWAMDEYMYHRRRGVFAFFTFVCCFVNYYFFVGQVVFLALYWLVRFFSGEPHYAKITKKDFALLWVEAVLGVACSFALLLPTLLAITQNNRINNPSNGWNALLYDSNQRYMHILSCFFFPPDLPARANFTPDSNSQWASLGAWLPLFSMSGVIAALQAKTKRWYKTLITVLFVMAAVPVLNSAFQLFNASYYARWFYMLTLIMSLCTVTSLQREDVDWGRAIRWTLAITLVIGLSIGLMPSVTTNSDDNTKVTTYGLEKYPTRFWAYVSIALVSLLLLVIVFKYYKHHKQFFLRMATGGVALISVIYSLFYITTGKTQSDDTHNEIIPYALNGGADIHLPSDGKQFCRIDVYDGMDNLPMYWKRPTIQAFHSIVPGSIMDFYPTVGVTRDVASRPDVSVYAIRSLLSCRWLFDPINHGQEFIDSSTNQPRMPGWSYYTTQNGSKIYENQYFIPMGFSYDQYITRSEYDLLPEANRSLALLKALVVEDTDVQKAKEGGLTHFDKIDSTNYTEDRYFADCKKRAATACSSFTTDNLGFTAKATSAKERLIFFSVPWESGWSAEVNGSPAEIVKVNVGFMAVKVPAGESTIRFTYSTPGLKPGVAVTAVSFVLLGGYLYATDTTGRWRRKKLPAPPKTSN